MGSFHLTNRVFLGVITNPLIRDQKLPCGLPGESSRRISFHPFIQNLVGGWTNPFEKSWSNGIISPSKGEHKKCLKPPTRTRKCIFPDIYRFRIRTPTSPGMPGESRRVTQLDSRFSLEVTIFQPVFKGSPVHLCKHDVWPSTSRWLEKWSRFAKYLGFATVGCLQKKVL